MLEWRIVMIAALAVAAFGAVIPIGLRIRFGAKDGTRWIQNWPSASTFMLSAYPLAVGLFIATLAVVPPFPAAGREGVLKIVSLVLVMLMALWATYDDFVHSDVVPVTLNARKGHVKDALHTEMELRRMSDRDARLKSPRSKAYAKLVEPFDDLKGIRERGSWLAYMLFLINFHGAVFFATFFWYIVVLAIWHRETAVVQPLVVIAILFSTWFVFRRYAQWYQFGIYKPDGASWQQIFFIVVLVAIIAAVTLYFLAERKPPKLALGAFVAGAVTLFALAETWPKANRAIGAFVDWLAGCRFVHFAVLYAAMMGFFITLAHSALVLEPIAPASAGAPAAVGGDVKQTSRPAEPAAKRPPERVP